jgi:polyhydroxybutyrate depolymerase
MTVSRSVASIWWISLLGAVAAACTNSGNVPKAALSANAVPGASAGTSASAPLGGSSSPALTPGGAAGVSGSLSNNMLGTTTAGMPGSLSANTAGAGAGGQSGTSAGSTGVAESAGMSGATGSANCGMRAGMRGKSSRMVSVSGTKRTYIAYLPQAASPTTPIPFVYVFHGASQTGSQLYDMSEYAKLSDTEGIALVFPDGQGVSSASNSGSLTPWNVTDGEALCGLGTLVSNANPVDFAFMDAMKADMEMDQCLDDHHIYATGFSMGGYLTHHIACERPEFRAAAPHSGGTIADLSKCKTTRMPIIIFHGTSDPLINDACDDPAAMPQSGFPASATLWAKKNGCKDTYATVPEMGTKMGNDGQCYVYDGCPADGQVEVCTFTNMQHAWAGAAVCENCIGSGAGWASATQLEWAFFKKYAW